MNNGTSTGNFNLQMGTKHGDPLFPYLRLISVVLIPWIRGSKTSLKSKKPSAGRASEVLRNLWQCPTNLIDIPVKI